VSKRLLLLPLEAGGAPPDATAMRGHITALEEEREENLWKAERYEELKAKNGTEITPNPEICSQNPENHEHSFDFSLQRHAGGQAGGVRGAAEDSPRGPGAVHQEDRLSGPAPPPCSSALLLLAGPPVTLPSALRPASPAAPTRPRARCWSGRRWWRRRPAPGTGPRRSGRPWRCA